MRKHLLITIFSLLLAAGGYAQITSVGLIGDATPTGWDADTNMTQVDDSTWALTVDLVIGEAKFRADDDWAVNWGLDTFPLGIGVQDGPNIPIPVAGTYEVSFNSNSGAYYFDAVSPVGVLGDATPLGWDEDIDMLPDPDNPTGFITELNLVPGEAKFRLNDDWARNWGSSDFPTGIGTQDGDNIPIPNTGNYTIRLDTATGEYAFIQNVAFDSVELIGDGTPGGWETGTSMNISSEDADVWELSVRLPGGGVQFQGNGGEITWGGSDFPSGTAEVDGDTIQVPAGLWVISLNTKTGEYSFDAVTIYGSVGIIGDATPGGWDADTDMERDPGDSSRWSLRIELLDGEAKFRADNDWAVNWGAGEFPSGTAVIEGANIPVTAGEYNVTFNSFTGEYNFQEIVVYDTIGLIGMSSPFGDWENDVLLQQSPDDENIWILPSVTLTDGTEGGETGVKFRVNLDWAINWGAASWPSGIGERDGSNIPCEAGTYGVTFNAATAEYMFGDVIVSTEDIVDPSEILAYPNPTRDILNIDISAIDMQGEATVRIYNMNGQLVESRQQVAETVMQVDVSNLPNGNYTLQLSGDNYIIGKRFVIAGK